MSESFEQVDFVRIFFKDGSCAFLKNYSLDVNVIITQLTEERAALVAENERLRKAGDEMMEVLESEIPFTAMNAVNGWLAAKEGGAK